MIFWIPPLLELRMWYQITIIRARMDLTSANDGLRKCKAWLTMVMIRKSKIMLWLIDYLTMSGWKDKRRTRVFVQSTNEKLGAVLVVNNEHDVTFIIIRIDDQYKRQKYRWSTIKPTHLIPLSKIKLWQQLYFHDHLSHMWACHYCNCAFRNDLGLIYLKQ